MPSDWERGRVYLPAEDLRAGVGEFGEAVRGAGSSAREELERRLADARSRRRARVDVAEEDDEESLA